MTSPKDIKNVVGKAIVIAVLLCLVSRSFAVIDPDNPPETMRGTVEKNGQTRTFYLEKQSIRGEHFELILLGTDGVTQTTLDAGPVRTYRGWCEEEADSYVEATLLPNGDLRYHVFKGAADDWWYDPPFETNENASAVNNFTELGGTPNQPSGTPYPGASFAIPAGTLDFVYHTTYQSDFGYDILVEYVNAYNYSNWETYARKAENAISHYNAIYTRDLLAETKLGKVVIRQSNAGLDRTSEQWGIDWWNINSYWSTGKPDEGLAPLFSDVDHHFVGMVGSVGGGVAYVGDYRGEDWAARSFNGWSGNGNWWHVARHEHGHNWGCGDCVEGCPGPDGSTVNSGNNITLSRFSNPEIDQIMNVRRNKYIYLRELGAYDFPVQPYANLDEYEAAAGSEPVAYDVLGNDYDANNDLIALASFPETTPLGGTLAFSAGTGPDGRDQLLYTPPAGEFGKDKFQYTIVDETGRTSLGNIIITVAIPNQTLRGYWKLDETTGTTAYDSTANANHGSLEGNHTFDANSVAGQYGGGLSFNGYDDYISVSDVDFSSDTVTITAWVKPNGTQEAYAAIVSSRHSGAANLNYKSNNELGYHWNSGNWGYNSGLSTPSGVWTFVAMVIEPDKATFYTYDGVTLNSVERIASHDPESFYGTMSIGRDDGRSDGDRHFNGDLDDVRIYSVALNAGQVLDVASGGGAESPLPFDGAVGVPTVTTLQWAMGASAVNNDVYFGTDYNAIANAGIASLQYMGRKDQASYQTSVLTANTEYFWRVDQVASDGAIIAGPVWRFTTGGNLGGITREVWQNIGSGNTITDLTGQANYPDNPDLTEILSSFEGPRDWAEAYGSRIHGFLVPPTTGSYTFWIASDDYGQLWLSSDADPANAVQIADVPGWAGSREWNKYPADQQSDPIPLTAGTVYYIMALHKEGGGGDNLAVAWSGPGISQQVIDGAYLAPYAPGLNWGPTFDANPLTAYDALEGYVYPGSIAGSATAMDGGAVTYAKAAGPLWLAIGADGFMSGVPGDGDIGINRFTVAATDSHGQTGTATLEITVFDTFTGERGLTDFAAIAARWLEADCTDTPACGGADLSGDNNVTTEDLLAFADMWLIDKPYGKLITHWTFDTDALDEVSDHDGTFVNGAAINTADATIGAGCLALDGIDDYVEISGYKGITGTAARTCSAWIKTSSASENPVITWGSPNAGQKWMFRVNSNGTLSVGVWAGYIQTLQTVNNGQWHHVAAVLPDGAASVDQIRLYIDGILETAPYYNNTQAINTSDAADVTIGSRMDEGYSQACFDGLIDEVKIFNRALTASEIEQLVSFSLHLHLPLDESSGTTAADQSQFERPGQLLDNPVWQPTGGQVNGALQFDGVDDYVEITGYKGIVGTAARTCSAWVKTSDSTGWKDIIGWGKMETGQRWLLTVTPDGFLQLAAVGGYQRGSTAINDGQWHHVAAVFDNDGTPDVSDVRFYIDGVEETAYTVLPQTLNTVAGQDVSIGLFNDGYDRFFNGLIDDVRIYDRALNQHEIQAIMGQ